LGSGQRFGCGGGVAKNNNQEIATNIEKKNIEYFNDEEGDDTYYDINLAVGEGVAGYNNQEMAAQLEAESTETANTTSSQAPHKEELVIGTNRSAYLMRKLTIEEEDTVKRALSKGALLPSSINQKDLLTLAGRKDVGNQNTDIIEM